LYHEDDSDCSLEELGLSMTERSGSKRGRGKSSGSGDEESLTSWPLPTMSQIISKPKKR
jgi:hypothetical protein